LPNAEWTVLIADDEPAARRGVRQLLQAFPDFTVIGECRDGDEVLSSLDRLTPDVLFLDVQMPGVDGFEVIRRRTPERMPAVVFLTAYDQHALRAFDAQALDYLVKPVTAERFAATMQRLRRQLAHAPRPAREPAIAVTTARGVVMLRLSEIDWIEAADNYARIWCGGRNYLLRESLQALEDRVQTSGFLRAHRQALVRLDAIQCLSWSGDDRLYAVLGSGVRIPVSRRRRAGFVGAVKGRAGEHS
jgi:two-component system, LytTR family, response regulator